MNSMQLSMPNQPLMFLLEHALLFNREGVMCIITELYFEFCWILP